MENGASMSPADFSALMGNDGFGNGNSWAWLLIILFAMGGNGFGWGNNGFYNNFATTDFVTNEFTQRDIADVNQNVSNTKYDLGTAVLENRFTNQLGQSNTNNLVQSTSCDVKQEVLQNRYDNAIQTQVLSSQLANEACSIRENSTANTQKILDKMCEQQIDSLRSQLNAKEAEVQELQLMNSQSALANGIINSLRPAPVPAYITASPYQSIYNPYTVGCGCNYANTLV